MDVTVVEDAEAGDLPGSGDSVLGSVELRLSEDRLGGGGRTGGRWDLS